MFLLDENIVARRNFATNAIARLFYEWIAVDVPFLLAKYLLDNYAGDPQIAQRVNAAELWIVPLVNPDGHEYSVATDRLWRKNRRYNGDGTFGVDLNCRGMRSTRHLRRMCRRHFISLIK